MIELWSLCPSEIKKGIHPNFKEKKGIMDQESRWPISFNIYSYSALFHFVGLTPLMLYIILFPLSFELFFVSWLIAQTKLLRKKGETHPMLKISERLESCQKRGRFIQNFEQGADLDP
jgi:hypothetical protein